MNPRQFLLFGGIVLLVLGIGGMTFLGPTPDASVLGELNWLDGTENVAHLVLGVVALSAYFFLKDEQLTKWLVILVGVIAALATIVGFMSGGNPVPNAGVTNLEMTDHIIHLVVTIWAFYAVFAGSKKVETAV